LVLSVFDSFVYSSHLSHACTFPESHNGCPFEESKEFALLDPFVLRDAAGCHGKQAKLSVGCLLPETSDTPRW